MDEIQVRMKLWVDAIINEKMDGVADELERILGSRTTEKCDKSIFKILLHLSHTANKCDKSKTDVGLEIWRIGCCVCSNMKNVPDAKKFFSSVYHIASCLLEMSLYREALEMCDYVLPGELWNDEPIDCKDMYLKVSHLLHNAAMKFLKKTKLATRKHFEILVTMIKYELDITKLAHRSYWRYVLSKILSYYTEVGIIAKKSKPSLYEEFTTIILAYIGHEKICLDDENKAHTYRLISLLITDLILMDINKTRIGKIESTLIRYFDVFRSSLQDCPSYLRCFNLYERLTTALVRPIKNLPSNVDEEIGACLREFVKLSGSEYEEAVKWYSYSAALLFGELLSYWEESAKSNMVQYLTDGLIESTMMLLEEQCSIFTAYEITTCRCSRPKKCDLNVDLYNNIALRLKTLAVVSRIFSNSSSSSRSIVTEKICQLAVHFCDECEIAISIMKDRGCGLWSGVWSVCGAHIYNIAISCEAKYYDKSAHLYSLLCTSFVKYEGLNAVGIGGKVPTLFSLRDPLYTVLHRLTSVHMNNGRYREAMLICSLNALLSSEIMNKSNSAASECKIYSSYAHIKHVHIPSRDTTMLECLRLGKHEIRKMIKIRFEDYDPIKVCLEEIKGLVIARVNLSSSIIMVLDEMEKLGASTASYAQGVHLLGYHLLNFKWESSIAKYLRKAGIKYEREPAPGTSFQWYYGHIKFYEFCERLREIRDKTESEMKSAKFAVKSTTNTSHGESTSSMSDPENVVPAYSTINITVTREIAACLEQALHVWKEAINADNYKDTLKQWEIVHTLDVITIAGEYARVYHLESLEVEAWKLAWKLARGLEDHRSIIYITARSLSSQYIDREWIEEADKSVKIIENSKDPAIRQIIVSYRLSLADLYYQNEDPESAKKLFLLATTEPDRNFISDPPNFLLTAHLKMNQSSHEDENKDQLNYTRIIVESLYTMLSIDDALETPIMRHKRDLLFHYDLLFEFTNNLAIRMNSLLSFREISAHLMRRLSTAQTLGAALRVAECLKSLCYIDLSRAKLDDCEVKLQGLEHILQIEGFDLTMKSQLIAPTLSDRIFPAMSSSSRVVEAVRDVGQSDTSPVLRNKVFANPDFILHGDLCACFKCANSRYQNLVFASTHLRAQLFSLQRNSAAAHEHFEGALRIKKNILSRASLTTQHEDNGTKNNKKLAILRSHRQLDVVEYVIFHLDYCRFLKWSMPQNINEGFEIALDALDLCEKYNLKNHPVYTSTNQLIFEYRFENLYSQAQFSKFTVPDVDVMDIGRYIHKPGDDQIICVTPAREIVPQKPVSVRRIKAPPFLKLEKVPIDLNDEEPPISTSPPARARRIPRRIINDDQQDGNCPQVANERDKSVVARINLSIPADDEEESVNVPKRSSSMRRKPENFEAAGSSQKMDKLFVEGMESEVTTTNLEAESSTKTGSKSRIMRQRGSASSRSTNSSSSRATNPTNIAKASTVPAIKIDEVTELLDELTVTKIRPSSSSIPSRSSNNTRTASNYGKTNENVITVPSDGASSSGDEITVEGRRTSSRLRKKSHEASSINKRSKFRSLNQSASNSEDEVVIIGTRTRRRAATPVTEQTSTAKESVKSSRSRVASKSGT